MNKTFKQIIWLYNNYRSKLLRTTAVTISFNEQMKSTNSKRKIHQIQISVLKRLMKVELFRCFSKYEATEVTTVVIIQIHVLPPLSFHFDYKPLYSRAVYFRLTTNNLS